MLDKFLIAVITPSKRNFDEFLRGNLISEFIEFKHISDEMHFRGVHGWIGYIVLYDSYNMPGLDKIIYNINLKTIKPYDKK